MQRSIDNFQTFVARYVSVVQRERFHSVNIDLVDVFAYDGDVLIALLCFDLGDVGDLIDLFYYQFIIGGSQLGTIVPIGFVAVIFFGIVRGCNHHSRIGFQLSDCKRQLGSGSHVFKQKDLEAIGCHYPCGCESKVATIVTAVVRYDTANFSLGFLLLDIVAKSLCCHRYGNEVHAICSQSHDASQSSRSKFQGSVKGIVEFLGIFFPHAEDFLLCAFVYATIQPSVCIVAGINI